MLCEELSSEHMSNRKGKDQYVYLSNLFGAFVFLAFSVLEINLSEILEKINKISIFSLNI